MSRIVVVGVLLIVCGVGLTLMPEQVATFLGRPYETAGERINMRASWGGVAIGLGLLITWMGKSGHLGGKPGQPRRRFALGLIMWLMLGIGIARSVGFVLDGSPDTMQWVWLVAEVVIAGACATGLRRGSSGQPEPEVT